MSTSLLSEDVVTCFMLEGGTLAKTGNSMACSRPTSAERKQTA
jgi:hypothetical protein